MDSKLWDMATRALWCSLRASTAADAARASSRVDSRRCVGARRGAVHGAFECVGLGGAVAEIVQAPFVLQVLQQARVIEQVGKDPVADVRRDEHRRDAHSVAREIVFFAVMIRWNRRRRYDVVVKPTVFVEQNN